MRTEEEMINLVLQFAKEHEDIRVVVMNGSRANPNAPKDPFQDYDIACFVWDMKPFVRNLEIPKLFGELMILQLPEDMGDPLPKGDEWYTYLMQFTDGNRIDLGFDPLERLEEHLQDSQTILLLDKDGRVGELPPPSDRSYLPKPPTAKQFKDCTNEFWWLNAYVAKGLWRDQLTYARHMLDSYMRDELMKMVTWHFGVQTSFQCSEGYLGKYLKRQIEPELWEMIEGTYADSELEHCWQALFTMDELFRRVGRAVAEAFGYPYPEGEDERVSAYIRRIKALPRDAKEI
jgi:aminoglycoside 6-adenylyltransferase